MKTRSGEKAREEIKKKCEWGDHLYDANWGNIRLVVGLVFLRTTACSSRWLRALSVSHCNVNLCVS